MPIYSRQLPIKIFRFSQQGKSRDEYYYYYLQRVLQRQASLGNRTSLTSSLGEEAKLVSTTVNCSNANSKIGVSSSHTETAV